MWLIFIVCGVHTLSMLYRYIFFFFCVFLSDDTYLDLINHRWEVPVPRAIEVIYSSSSGEGTDPRFLKLAPVFRCSMLKCGDKKRYSGGFPAIKSIIY